jgi:thermostable 8-oxoguanine DNA glycosylase
MNEKEIAENKVIPYLERLGWPKQLITQYGKVPVQMGTEIKWADIVALFVDENDSAVPYLVVEVKTALTNLNEILAQTDSYSKLLDAQYFVATNGEEYLVYQRRPSGGYIRINNVPVPVETHLTVTQDTKFKAGYILCEKPSSSEAKQTVQYRELSSKIDDYFNLMTEDKYYLGESRQYSLRNDITAHYKSIKWIHNLVHGEIDTLTPKEFKDDFDNSIMCYKPPNTKRIYSEVDRDFNKIKAFLRFIKEFKGEPEENLGRLFDTASELHINGMGPFIISQFLAGAHPRHYTIIEDRMVNTMKSLDLIDTKVKADTAKGYLYINEICKKLYSDIFNRKLEQYKSKLGFRIDPDFSLIVIHEFFWEYEEFQSYDAGRLEEATGDKRNIEKKETELNLSLVESMV